MPRVDAQVETILRLLASACPVLPSTTYHLPLPPSSGSHRHPPVACISTGCKCTTVRYSIASSACPLLPPYLTLQWLHPALHHLLHHCQDLLPHGNRHLPLNRLSYSRRSNIPHNLYMCGNA